MRIIRPILPTFGSQKQPDQQAECAGPDEIATKSLVLTTRGRTTFINRSRANRSTEFTAQLMAVAPRRGLKATAIEQARFIRAYRPLPTSQTTRHQKWA